jgi:hypothetical protein
MAPIPNAIGMAANGVQALRENFNNRFLMETKSIIIYLK